MSFRTPICDMFEIDVPIFLAGMGQVAFAEVCAAVSEAGGYGTLGMAGSGPDQIREEMRKVRKLTDKPFGVDLLAALPEQMVDAIDIIIAEGASAFIAGLGVPAQVIDRCHGAGLKVMSMCGKVEHAVRAAEAGCDAVVAQGSEAGGHTGKIAGMALIPQIVDAVQIPVLGAGSIVDGRGMAAALALGAQGVWMGTRFIASDEANAATVYKQRVVEAGSADTTVTRCYSGKPMRVIHNAYVADWEDRPQDLEPFPLQLVNSWRDGVTNFTAGADADAERTMMPCGQGAGAIHEVLPVREIVRRVMDEAQETMARLGRIAAAS